MGADLLLIGLVQDENTTLNWPAGRRFIQRMPANELQAIMEEINGDPCDTVTEARKEANAIISALKTEVTNGVVARDAYSWQIRGAILHIRGGTSWGDSPSEGFDVFCNAYYFPGALVSIGFELGEGRADA